MTSLLLERFSYAPDGTFGKLTLPSGRTMFTCEQPWRGNTTGRSCIPEGVYDLQLRESPVVKRSSGGDFLEGWEVTDVPGRTYIMLHPANWPHELRGCISVGLDYSVIGNKQGVASSREAFRQLMAELSSREGLRIEILQYRPEYP